MSKHNEQMNIVVVGHVDHGKSTVIGRMLADTNSLPEGKLESVKAYCKKNSKEFEYAFLLDALKDEQAQGITIDSARCFFKSQKREYIIIDAPGHIEFLKNMISGAARAEAAVLVIDAEEGVQENSKRHAYMLSMLGIDQVLVAINKMDLVDYREETYTGIVAEFKDFLSSIDVEAQGFIPVSGREGDNIAHRSEKTAWYEGTTLLAALDAFRKAPEAVDKAMRMPVQAVYKFTATGDSRRIIAGRVETGRLKAGDEVIFLPSMKTSTITAIEEFNTEHEEVSAGMSTGVSLKEQIYVNRGDVMCKTAEDICAVGTQLKASVFWVGKEALITGKEYKLKLGTAEMRMKIKEISRVLNSSSMDSEERDEVRRHEVAELIIECRNAVAYDLASEHKATGRFVIVDDYDIAGGGIITERLSDEYDAVRNKVLEREKRWEPSEIGIRERARRYGQKPVTVLITGKTGVDKKSVAKLIEKELFNQGRAPYFLGIGNLLRGVDADVDKLDTREHVRRLGEVSNILMDAGMIVLATASDLGEEELKLLRTIVEPVIVVRIGDGENGCDLSLSGDNTTEHAHAILDFLSSNEHIYQ